MEEDNHQQEQMVLPVAFDMTTFEDVSLYSCTQYDFMKTADELLSSATFADCSIDSNKVTLHEIILEGTCFCSSIECSFSRREIWSFIPLFSQRFLNAEYLR